MVRSALLLAMLAWATTAWAADARDSIARARLLYNQHDYDGAIALADDARRDASRADDADLVVARALLERFRANGSADDLTEAGMRLRRVAPDHFPSRERIEYVVGLGEALFFGNAPGAAGALFDSALETPDLPAGDVRDLVLDWWASALDQDARPRTEFERQPIYARIRERMRAELGRNPASGTAAYWSAASARGEGDLQGAWSLAQAGWVRAPLSTYRAAVLRGDLDQLVLKVLVPERARLLGQPPEALRDEWEQFKETWKR